MIWHNRTFFLPKAVQIMPRKLGKISARSSQWFGDLFGKTKGGCFTSPALHGQWLRWEGHFKAQVRRSWKSHMTWITWRWGHWTQVAPGLLHLAFYENIYWSNWNSPTRSLEMRPLSISPLPYNGKVTQLKTRPCKLQFQDKRFFRYWCPNEIVQIACVEPKKK